MFVNLKSEILKLNDYNLQIRFEPFFFLSPIKLSKQKHIFKINIPKKLLKT